MSSAKANCPQCGNAMSVAGFQPGTQVLCPHCRHQFALPGGVPPVVTPPPPVSAPPPAPRPQFMPGADYRDDADDRRPSRSRRASGTGRGSINSRAVLRVVLIVWPCVLALYTLYSLYVLIAVSDAEKIQGQGIGIQRQPGAIQTTASMLAMLLAYLTGLVGITAAFAIIAFMCMAWHFAFEWRDSS